MQNPELRRLVDRVHDAEHGIEIEVEHFEHFVRRFYRLRLYARSQGDLKLDGIICRKMDNTTVHLVHKETEATRRKKGTYYGQRRLGEGHDPIDNGSEGET